MYSVVISADSSFYETIKNFGGIIIWLGFIFIVIILTISYFVRRKPKEIKCKVLKPIFKAMSVESELYGYKPVDSDDLLQANSSTHIYNTAQIDDIVRVVEESAESEK